MPYRGMDQTFCGKQGSLCWQVHKKGHTTCSTSPLRYSTIWWKQTLHLPCLQPVTFSSLRPYSAAQSFHGHEDNPDELGVPRAIQQWMPTYERNRIPGRNASDGPSLLCLPAAALAHNRDTDPVQH